MFTVVCGTVETVDFVAVFMVVHFFLCLPPAADGAKD